MPETSSADGGVAQRAHGELPSGADAGWGVTSTLISGMVVWGGAGWLLDRWLDNPWFFALGVLLGVGVGIYLVMIKYGTAGVTTREDAAVSSAGRRSRTGTQKGRR